MKIPARKHLSCLTVFVVAFLRAALAQQPAENAVPATGMNKQQALERAAAYDTALKMLGASGGIVGPNGQANPSTTAKHERKQSKETVEPLPLTRTAPLPGSVKAALAMSDSALNADPQPKPSPDGRVIYTWGRGIPPIVCALLQVTEIDLEPGEHATEKDVDVGDDEFHISVHKGADRVGDFDYLIIKPTVANVETTLTVGTNRRVYYFRLIATQTEHIARLSFTYPDEEERRKKAEEQLAKAKEEEAVHLAALAPSRTIKNWKYSLEVHGKEAHYMIPSSVGDDGSRTYIQLSQDVRKIGLPVLEIAGAMGPIPANSHWEEDRLVVDALFDRGCLLEGVGKKRQRVCIHNEAREKDPE
jgi:type IV secretion system protein VirB9